MFRNIENDLIAWQKEAMRKPLLIRGARQVGKSYAIEKFGENHFKNYITVNFELEPRYISCFENLDPHKICKGIELIAKQPIKAGETLLFLDEIQQSPQALLALRYFKEKYPELHVIGAGSFLEFILGDETYQQPVGRVQSLYLKPCSFTEFLVACGDKHLVDHLAQITLADRIETGIHELLLEKCREYFILGGMPEAIAYYIKNKKFYGCEKIHATILEYYRRDFAKYQKRINPEALEKVFLKSPGLIAQRFKYTAVDPDKQAKSLKPALDALIKAGIVYPVYHSSASGLPFVTGKKDNKFKLLFLDVGLAKHATGLDLETLLNEHLILLNQGALAEQFVGQELLAYARNFEQAELYYWKREKVGSQAEVDYLMHVGPTIYPIEVKAGKTGRLKSLQVFLDEKKLQVGIRISQNQFRFEQRILSIPLYLIHELPRLLKLL